MNMNAKISISAVVFFCGASIVVGLSVSCGKIEKEKSTLFGNSPAGSYCNDQIAGEIPCGTNTFYKYIAGTTVESSGRRDKIDGCYYLSKTDAFNSVNATCNQGGTANCDNSSQWQVVSRTHTNSCPPPPKENPLPQGSYRSNTDVYIYTYGDGNYCRFADEQAFNKWVGSGILKGIIGNLPSNVRGICNIQTLPAPKYDRSVSSRGIVANPVCHDKRATAHCEWLLENVEKLPGWWGLIKDSAVKDASGSTSSDYYYERAAAHCKYVLDQRNKWAIWYSIDYSAYRDCW